MLVDDEESGCVGGRRMLAAGSYRVFTARNGAEGIVKYQKRKKHIRVVVTGMAMPVMEGTSLIRALRQISPELRIIAISGLPAQADETSEANPPVDAFISKPFVAAKLIEALHSVLATR